MKIFLIGYRCTGKTTIGQILANILNFSFLDIDKQIESETGSSIASIVKTSGWPEFRNLEKQALIKTYDKNKIIVSTGGGIVLDIENRTFLKNNGLSIWLFANKDVILDRLKKDKNTLLSRPSLLNKKSVDGNLESETLENETSTLISQREPIYSEITQTKFDTSTKTPEEIAQMIKRRILNDR
ncbi:MAG: shikimate kinase [Desulfobacterales bacterium]|nr:shikimate kinase [Desulfobacterales bacterium]